VVERDSGTFGIGGRASLKKFGVPRDIFHGAGKDGCRNVSPHRFFVRLGIGHAARLGLGYAWYF
jgi:hypothetical protein